MTGSGEEAVAVHEGMLEKEMEMAGKEKRRKKNERKRATKENIYTRAHTHTRIHRESAR